MGDFPRSQSASPPPPPPPPPPLPHQSPAPLEFELLFSASPESLPGPLPSPEDIEDSPNRVADLTARCTAVLDECYVVKFGPDVEPLEAKNMRFVREHTNIRVPKIFAVYQRAISEKAKITYIIMERLHGHTLQNIWGQLQASEKSQIVAQLRSLIQSLRNLPHPGYFGSLDGSKLRDDIFWMPESLPPIDSSFNTEQELLNGILERYLHDSGESARHRVDFYRRVLPRILKGSGSPVFTHNDLRRKNIMITPENTVVILGWAKSGWYPSYWEYATTMYTVRPWEDDWHAYIAEILEELPNHFLWMQTLRIEMWS